MKLEEILTKLERRIPKSWAESWDNPGLSVGNPVSDVSLIAAALDANEHTIDAAVKMGAGLLVTHHPLIFKPLKSLIFNRPLSRAVEAVVRNGLAVYSCHTNWDSSPEGVNKILAEKLGLTSIVPLIPAQRPDRGWGIGAAGTFCAPVSVTECVRIVSERWQISPISAYGDENAVIDKAAIGGGSCGDMWNEAVEAGAQIFITSDMSYHDRQDALAMGLNLIITDHGDTERISLDALAKITEYETGITVKLIKEPLSYKRII